eukprot:5307014-Amphidinium_carterae.1
MAFGQGRSQINKRVFTNNMMSSPLHSVARSHSAKAVDPACVVGHCSLSWCKDSRSARACSCHARDH